MLLDLIKQALVPGIDDVGVTCIPVSLLCISDIKSLLCDLEVLLHAVLSRGRPTREAIHKGKLLPVL